MKVTEWVLCLTAWAWAQVPCAPIRLHHRRPLPPPPPPGSLVHVPGAFQLPEPYDKLEHVIAMGPDGTHALHFSLENEYGALDAFRRKDEARIICVPWEEVARALESTEYRVIAPSAPPDLAGMRMREQHMTSGSYPAYDLFRNNCEHAATYFVSGRARSAQVVNVLSSLGVPLYAAKIVARPFNLNDVLNISDNGKKR